MSAVEGSYTRMRWASEQWEITHQHIERINMRLTGEQLYNLFAEACEEIGSSVDVWEDIQESESAIWEALAKKVQLA